MQVNTLSLNYISNIYSNVLSGLSTPIQPPSDYQVWLSLRSELQSLFWFVSLELWENPTSGCWLARRSVSLMPKHVCVSERWQTWQAGKSEWRFLSRWHQRVVRGDFCTISQTKLPSGLPQHSLLLLAPLIEITAFIWWRISFDNCPYSQY